MPETSAISLSNSGDREVLELLLPQVRRFSAGLDARAIEAAREVDATLRRQAAELGLFGLSIPEEHGGLGLSLAGVAEVIATVAAADRSVATTVGLHGGLGIRGLIEFGSPALKARYLPLLASGEMIAAFAATEAGAGSDLAAVATTGRLDGDHLCVSGEKAYVTNGGFADLFTVLARTPGYGGARAHCLLLIPRNSPGITIGPEEHKLGICGSSTLTVTFDDVRVPLDHVIGEPGKGMSHAYRVLEWGRSLMAAGCVGTGRAALDMAVTHVATRRQFGRSLDAFESTRAHLGRMASLHFAMACLVEEVGRRDDAGRDIATASAAAKVLCSEGAFELCDRSIQLHGALGYIEETGVARLLRDCRVTRIFEGANDVLLVHMGTALLAGAESSSERMLHAGAANDGVAACLPMMHRWADIDATLSAAIVAAKKKHGIAVVKKQVLLQRVATAHVCLLAASATLRRANEQRTAAATVLANHAARHLLRKAAAEIAIWTESVDDAALDAQVFGALSGNLEGDAAPGPGDRNQPARPDGAHVSTHDDEPAPALSRSH